ARCRKDRAWIVRRGSAEPLRKRGDGACTGVDVLGEADTREVELARRAVVAAVQLAAQDEAGSEAGADREEDEVVDAARDPTPALAERGEVDAVLDRDRRPDARGELAVEVLVLEAGHVLCERDPAGCGVDRAGHAEDDAVDEVVARARRAEQRSSKPPYRIDPSA